MKVLAGEGCIINFSILVHPISVGKRIPIET